LVRIKAANPDTNETNLGVSLEGQDLKVPCRNFYGCPTMIVRDTDL